MDWRVESDVLYGCNSAIAEHNTIKKKFRIRRLFEKTSIQLFLISIFIIYSVVLLFREPIRNRSFPVLSRKSGSSFTSWCLSIRRFVQISFCVR